MTDDQRAAMRLIDHIVDDPGLSLSYADVSVLERVRDRTPAAARILAVHYGRIGAVEQAHACLVDLFASEPDSESARNLAVSLIQLRRSGEAIRFVREHVALIDPIARQDLLCWAHYRAGDYENAVAEGDKALELKDASVDAAPALDPVICPLYPANAGCRVISFSLFGDADRYLDGAYRNAVVAQTLYPGWQVRFYADHSVPDCALAALEREKAELCFPGEAWPAARYGLFWRFLVEDDPEVGLYIVRDADSVMTAKERAAVADWLSSGHAFHLMRDLPCHCELVLAGLWGAHRGNIQDMAGRIRRFVAAEADSLNPSHIDQIFTRRVLWPIMRQDLCAHDSWFSFGNPRRFPGGADLPPGQHIGRNDFAGR
ncbi:MAG: hypothetical protein AAGE80_17070 [Pseudomonadota bacterium]